MEQQPYSIHRLVVKRVVKQLAVLKKKNKAPYIWVELMRLAGYENMSLTAILMYNKSGIPYPEDQIEKMVDIWPPLGPMLLAEQAQYLKELKEQIEKDISETEAKIEAMLKKK